MSHVIYVSTAVSRMSEDDLVHLLRQARRRNKRLDITGMLLYQNGRFMQVLEGDEDQVNEIYLAIQNDWRHKNVDTLRAEQIERRNFPDWSMGFRNIDTLESVNEPGLTRLLDKGFKADFFRENYVEAHALLLAFKKG
ncbi:MAG: BLUF domain-containing protein [Pseudomonadales bacterium]